MKIRSDWDDDEIRFAGFGSAHAISENATPVKLKKRKFKVGFAIPKKPKSSRDSSRPISGVKA